MSGTNSTASRRERLLDDDAPPTSDDYIAYAGGSTKTDSPLYLFCVENKKMISIAAGVMIAILILIAIVVAAEEERSSGGGNKGPGVPAIADGYRLPSNVIPSRYTLDFSISTDITTNPPAPFGGVVTIDARIVNASMPAFLLHSLYLNISSVNIAIDNKPVNSSSFIFYLYGQTESRANSIEVASQYLVIQGVGGYVFPITDSLRIAVAYRGSGTRNANNGLYVTSYTDTRTQQVKYVAATQFEATNARRAFPCFDEPAFKAVFSVKITVPTADVTVLSNGLGIRNEVNPDGSKTWYFNDTCLQSTYLMGFTVGPWEYVDANKAINLGYEFRGYGRPDLYKTMQNITDRGAMVHKWFHSELAVKYPQQKVSQVAIPNKGGAMENYGIVMYAENLLYVNDDTTSVQYGSAVNVNAHELAHFVWGDLMTPLWWSNNWLKEGSATFWSYVGQQAIMGDSSDWNSDALAVNAYQEGALQLDAEQGAPPLVNPLVLTPADIQGHFGGITYNKGGSFLRMIRGIMGNDNFFTGCRNFLQKYQLSNALSIDFFGFLDAQSPIKVDQKSLYDILYFWAHNAGHPRVLVAVSEPDSTGQRTWTLTQQRYGAPIGDNTRYPIYLEFVRATPDTKLTKIEHIYLDSTNSYQNTIITKPGDLLKFNFNRTGFYRVQYPSAILDTWSTELKRNPSLLPAQQDKIGLIHDAYQLQLDGYTNSWAAVLNITSILAYENNYAPIQTGLTRVSNIWSRVRFAANGDDISDARAWVQSVFAPVTNSLNWGPITLPDHLTGLMQQALGPVACKFRIPACTRMATDAFINWFNTSTLPHPNIRETVFQFAELNQDGSGIKKLLACYRDLTLPASTARLCLRGFLGHASADVIDDLLDQYFTDEFRLRDGDTLLSIVTLLNQVNDVARQSIMTYFIQKPNRWDAVRAKSNINVISSMINILVGQAQTQSQLNEATSFFDTRLPGINPDDQGTYYANARAAAAPQIAWVTQNWPPIKAWIKAVTNPFNPPSVSY